MSNESDAGKELKQQERRQQGGKQRGGILVIIAGGLFAIMSIVALVIASGYLATNETRTQNATNLAALGAIERYTRYGFATPGPTPSYQDRAEVALDYANSVLNLQDLVGTTSSTTNMGTIGFAGSSAPGGEMIFGRWFPDWSSSGHPECGGNPSDPCFSPDPQQPGSATSPLNPVNAVRINLRVGNSFISPFLDFLTGSSLGVNGSAVGSVVPRCTALLMDASSSTFETTHVSRWQPDYSRGSSDPYSYRGFIPANSSSVPTQIKCEGMSSSEDRVNLPHLYLCPRNRSLFAFDLGRFGPFFGSFDPDDIFLSTQELCQRAPGFFDSPYQYNVTHQGAIWCNMAFEGGTQALGRNPPGIPGLPPRQRYIDDYRVRSTPYGNMLVDVVTPPKPFSDFMQGFNSGVRMMISQSSSTDRAVVMAFKGKVFYQFPPESAPVGQKLTTDLGFVQEVTDASRYQEPERTPNFLSLGWISREQEGYSPDPTRFKTEGGSNIVQAVDKAISLLSDPLECPASAQKSIILASDGMMNCEYRMLTADWDCSNDRYEKYLASEDYILRQGFDDATPNPENSILARMQRNRIVFSTLMAGKSQPHVLNRRINGEWITYEKAKSYGMRGLPGNTSQPNWPYIDPTSDDQIMVDLRSNEVTGGVIIPERCNLPEVGGVCDTPEGQAKYAWYNQWQDNVYFRRPVGVFMELALRTGGAFCPFLNPSPNPNHYCPGGTPCTPDNTSELSETYRESLGENQRIPFANVNRSIGEEAAACVQQTLGLNPFLLVRPQN